MQNEFCLYCGLKISCQDVFTYEHLIPVSKGGNNSKLNKKPCCKYCNVWRGNKDLEQWKIEVISIMRSGNKKRKAGRCKKLFYSDQDLWAIVENIFHWQRYISEHSANLLKQKSYRQIQDKAQGHIKLNSAGDVFCFRCKKRGPSAEHATCIVNRSFLTFA